MLKMNSACIIIQCAAIDPHLFDDGGRIGSNEFRVRLDESLLAAALVICFAAQCGKALAYACNNNYYVVWAPSALTILRARAREAHCGMS